MQQTSEWMETPTNGGNLASLPNILASPLRHCDGGEIKASSNASKQMVDIADMPSTSLHLSPTPQDDRSSMPESLPTSSLLTLSAKLSTCNPCIPSTRCFEISALDLTTSAKASLPFWDSSIKELSQKWWSPTEIASADLGLSCLNCFSSSKDPFLRSLMIQTCMIQPENCQKTCLQSSRFFQHATTDEESTVQPKVVEEQVTCRKIRIYPNPEQKKLFNKCLGASRYFFNKANAHVRQSLDEANSSRLAQLNSLKSKGCTYQPKSGKNKGEQCCQPIADDSDFKCKKHITTPLGFDYSFMTLPNVRNQVLTPDSKLTEDIMWQKDVPYDTRQLAIKEVLAAYKSQLALKKLGLAQRVFVGFRSKKASRCQTFNLDSGAFDLEGLTIFSSRLKRKKKLRMRRRDKKKIKKEAITVDGDSKIMKTVCGKWYICVVRKVKPQTVPKPAYHAVFNDPGVRTFQTFYSPDGICGKMGDGYVSAVLDKKFERVDHLTSLAAKTGNKKTKRRMLHRNAGLRTKIQNCVNDLHRKSAATLTDYFDTIFMPPFETQRMANKDQRNISKTTTRRMLCLSHYRFRMHLQHVCKVKGRTFVLTPEQYTTKTCGSCGALNDVGSAKVFTCRACGYVADRDIQAARNIGLKAAWLMAS